jgi:phage tail sheath protein FI
LITKIIRTAEDRADALAIVDLKGGYQPNTEAVGTEKDRRGSLANVITDLQGLQENSSYACAYYPWVQIRDPEKGALVWVPPSVAALGVFANTEATDELWFAPAGFRRGGLSNGAAGLPVVGTSQRLTSKDRDNLYEANINPIANFPNEGIVVFGQKTLQVTPSALDRINVRRLMNYVKKEISRMANDILFQPNVEETWVNFTSRVNPFLASVRARFGLDDFKVVLDKTTTTPELIDRNIVYAKIFLKPTKAIEYIAIDFNITNSGASFED